jgi:hypothetical protein
MARILQNTDATLTQTFYVAGTATDMGAVTVTITRTNGTALYTAQATTNNGDGTYTFPLTDTDTARLDRLTCEWLATTSNQTLTSYVEIVGAHLVTEAQIRAFDPALANTTNYPDANILAVRDRVTDRLEHWTKRSWVPRFRYGKFAGTGGYRLEVQDAQQTLGGSGGEGAKSDVSSLIAASIGGTAVTASNVDVVDGGFWYTTGIWSTPTIADPLNVVAEWAYGLPVLVDGVDRICLLLIRDYLTRGPVSEYAISAANDFGTTRFIQEGGPMRNPSRIPEVNDWVRSHSAHIPLVV